MADYHSSEDEFCSILFGFFGGPVATGFVAGRFADALEKEGAGAATDYCLAALRATFGNGVEKHVLTTTETAWRQDPFALGSYSYAKLGRSQARSVLAQPVANRVFFGGEASMKNTYSTVHGAYLSGNRVAEEIKSLSKPNS